MPWKLLRRGVNDRHGRRVAMTEVASGYKCMLYTSQVTSWALNNFAQVVPNFLG